MNVLPNKRSLDHNTSGIKSGEETLKEEVTLEIGGDGGGREEKSVVRVGVGWGEITV